MRSIDELRGFLAVHKQADDYAKSVNSDLKSDDYRKSYVHHFKHLLSLTAVDFAVCFLDELSQSLTEEKIDVKHSLHFEFGYISTFVKYLPSELEAALKLQKDLEDSLGDTPMLPIHVRKDIDALHNLALQLDTVFYDTTEMKEAHNEPTCRLSDWDRDEILKEIEPIADSLISFFVPNTHGGVRKGAGRHKKEDSKNVRMSISLAEPIYKLKGLYDNLSDKDKQEVQEQIENLIHFAKLNQLTNQKIDTSQKAIDTAKT